MRRWLIGVVLGLLGIAVLLVNSNYLQKTPAPKPGVNGDKLPQEKITELPGPKTPADYFPLTAGSTWRYLGEGNEYASFTREVLFTGGDRAQIREDNGGTASAAVFQVHNKAVVRLFFQGEAYENADLLNHPPNDDTVILQTPIEVGTKWNTAGGLREIVDVNSTVDAPAGRFTGCIKVKIAGQHDQVFEYFKDGVGMVRREFVSGDTRVTSTLEEYTVK